jgi:hypothetical protein
MVKIWRKGDVSWETIALIIVVLIVIVLCSLLAYSAYKKTGGLLGALP